MEMSKKWKTILWVFIALTVIIFISTLGAKEKPELSNKEKLMAAQKYSDNVSERLKRSDARWIVVLETITKSASTTTQEAYDIAKGMLKWNDATFDRLVEVEDAGDVPQILNETHQMFLKAIMLRSSALEHLMKALDTDSIAERNLFVEKGESAENWRRKGQMEMESIIQRLKEEK